MSEEYQADRPTPPSLELDRELIQQASVSPPLVDRLGERRRLLVALMLVGTIVLLASVVGLWLVTQSPDGVPGSLMWAAGSTGPSNMIIAPPRSLKEVSNQYPELSQLLQDSALSSVYKDFILAWDDGGLEAALDLARRRGMLNAQGDIRITLTLDSAENVPPLLTELAQAGIVVEGSYERSINIGIPLDLIQTIAEEEGAHALFARLSQLEHIIRLELPLPNRVDRLRTVEGEGVSITGAELWHDARFTGQDIRVGVLDLGFDGYKDLLGSELPGSVTARSFVHGQEPDGCGEIHGTACAEIVYEMAPDAQLFLAYYDGTTVSEGQAVDWLLQQGVHIITHSAGSVMAPMDGSGPNAELADRAANTGVLWVNSSGNEAEGHYRSTFTDNDGDALHEFPDGSEEIAIEAQGDSVTVVLNWDDWAAVTEDYDLFVYDTQGDLVASAEDAQDGSPGQIAAEGLMLRTLEGEIYHVAVAAYETSRAGVLDLYVPGAVIEFPVVQNSLSSPADARGAISVGATAYRDDSIASYSSQGPTTDGRLKPDISGPAGVSGVTYGDAGFDGTSASAPHVAGAAALVWSAYPALGRDDVSAYLISHALDVGPSGPDNAYGHGRLRLPLPPEEKQETGLRDATEAPIPTATREPLTPSLTPISTSIPVDTPQPILDCTTVTPVPNSPSSAGPPLVVLMGLASVGLCGGVAVLGGAGLLLVARKGVDKPSAPVSSAHRQPSAPAASIEAAYGELRGEGIDPIILREGILSIGRESDNHVVLDHPTVSRHHARILCARGTCRLEDLESSNGSFVDGERVVSASLTRGSRIRFGDATLTLASPSSETTMAWLEMEEERFRLSASEVIIGRSSDAFMRLTDQLASRRHARIDRRGSIFVLTDLNSTNGTFVNDRSVHDHVLRDGDRIRIGRTQLKFHG